MPQTLKFPLTLTGGTGVTLSNEGTNFDASQLGQLQEQALMSGSSKQQVAGETEKMSVGPPKRFSGLPKEAANNNVDRRTERRVG